MEIADFLSDADLDAIRDAATAAEERTSGEIVPYLVDRVDEHPEGRLKAALGGALTAALVAGLVHALGGFWGGAGALWITLPTLAGAAAGALAAAFLPGLERRLVNPEDLDHRVLLRAHSAFLEEGVFATRERTGILVFLALFERRALILADAGIHEKVAEDEWTALVGDLVGGVKEGRVKEALIGTIGRCGELLERHGVARRADDRDELDDAPRTRER